MGRRQLLEAVAVGRPEAGFKERGERQAGGSASRGRHEKDQAEVREQLQRPLHSRQRAWGRGAESVHSPGLLAAPAGGPAARQALPPSRSQHRPVRAPLVSGSGRPVFLDPVVEVASNAVAHLQCTLLQVWGLKEKKKRGLGGR